MHAHIAAIKTRLDCVWKIHFESQPKKDSRNSLVYGLLKIIVKAKQGKENEQDELYLQLILGQ